MIFFSNSASTLANHKGTRITKEHYTKDSVVFKSNRNKKIKSLISSFIKIKQLINCKSKLYFRIGFIC